MNPIDWSNPFLSGRSGPKRNFCTNFHWDPFCGSWNFMTSEWVSERVSTLYIEIQVAQFDHVKYTSQRSWLGWPSRRPHTCWMEFLSVIIQNKSGVLALLRQTKFKFRKSCLCPLCNVYSCYCSTVFLNGENWILFVSFVFLNIHEDHIVIGKILRSFVIL